MAGTELDIDIETDIGHFLKYRTKSNAAFFSDLIIYRPAPVFALDLQHDVCALRNENTL